MNNNKYWMAAISKEHTRRGVAGGFIQLCHGKQAPLKRMKKGDWIIVYSSKESMEEKTKCQAFTAIGQVIDEHIYSFQMSDNFVPFRRNINFYNSNEISILPLIHQLHFMQNKKSWGYPFRFGFFEIQENDFKLIFSKMIHNEITIQKLHFVPTGDEY